MGDQEVTNKERKGFAQKYRNNGILHPAFREGLIRELAFTRVYRENADEHPAIREALCMKEQFPSSLQPPLQNDLFVGRYLRPVVRFTQHACDELAYCVDEKLLKAIIEDSTQAEWNRQVATELLDYWKTENTASKVRAAFPPKMAEFIPSDKWMEEPGIVFPLYRMCGAQIHFDKLLQLGIPGLKNEVVFYQKKDKSNELYEGMLMALDLLEEVCLSYAEQIKELILEKNHIERKKELSELVLVLQRISRNKPETLQEAIQLFWLYSVVSGVRNYGRMDVYFGDFLAADLDAGRITEETALRYLQSLWKLIADTKTVFESRIIIGGKGRRNEENADRFALLAMEASRTVKEIEPQLSLRLYTGMKPELYDKALDVLAEGRTYPILYNDDINISAVKNAFVINEQEAAQYVPFGCGEYIIDHKSMGTPSGVINLQKILEVTLHNGIDPMTGKLIGLQTGKLEEFKSFDDLWNAFMWQAEFAIQVMAEHEELEYKIVGEQSAYLFTSMLYDGCLESGKAIFDGGIPYLGGTLETYGNTNTADSLLAIKELVFNSNHITLEELVDILDKDFENYELVRKELIDVPKYGNDHDIADEMAQKLHDAICLKIREQNLRTNLHSYLVVIINNQANTLLGKWTSASADGRNSGQPLANGNTPSGGNDKNGMTALLNSLAKLDPSIHAGAVQNLKLSRDLFTEKRPQLQALLETYFVKGGTQAMITVVNRDELEQAMITPEKYGHIFVRVGGFSARFVELSKEVQQEILSRTLY
jgi:pyruvate-formate lyase